MGVQATIAMQATMEVRATTMRLRATMDGSRGNNSGNEGSSSEGGGSNSRGAAAAVWMQATMWVGQQKRGWRRQKWARGLAQSQASTVY